MVVRGHVQNGVIVLDEGVQLPEGHQVTVVASDVAAQTKYEVTPEKRDAILSLIGIWKSDSPPDDEEVERIIDEYRTQKYG